MLNPSPSSPTSSLRPLGPRLFPILIAALAIGSGLTPLAAAPDRSAPEGELHADQLTGLVWRDVGPYRGGRSAAVAGIPSQPHVYYFGATGGGVWKTSDGGGTWSNVSDGYFGGSIGAVAVSEWDPNVVYVGGGEKTVRGNVSHGDGVWKSTDAGRTWKHVGLGDTRHVPRIRIHPKNPDLVWVAALGHLFGPNEERGVFRSADGGDTWEKILFVNDEVGAVDLVLDPTNPRILYATFWRVLRTPWSLESGGEGSSLWKSTDGGDNWEELTSNPGLPEPPIGISGITVSPTDPDNLYAIVEAEDGGVFRSRDAGETWARVNQQRDLRQRAWYYTRIYADPASEEGVYVVNVRFHHSQDGGKTFRQIPTPHADNHDLWIDPEDPRRMVEANDGGANVSYDGGETWSIQSNQPTAQFYRVSTDNAFPYRLLGGQQDNSAVRVRSRSVVSRGGIGVRDWEPTAGGESGHIIADPENPDIVYGGSYGGFLTRVDHRTGEIRAINVWPDNPMGWGAAELEYRFQWNFPIFFSPHDPDVLYAAANVLFKSTDEGQSWRSVSGDLTRNDKSKMGPSGGPITKDNTSVEYYGTIFAAAESPHEAGVLWAGSDDGLIHVSRNGGQDWRNVTPKDLPEWAQINSVDPHPFEAGGLYVAATRYKLDDFNPYLYLTVDYGETWRRIDGAGRDGGIAEDHFTRVIRADPDRRGLLYAGTERGVYVSFDDGARWSSLQLDLPIVPITDLAVKEKDLVAATQGRGFWILDDLTPLHQWNAGLREAPAHLFSPRAAHRLPGGGGFGGPPRNVGQNPPNGVVFYYHLSEAVLEGEPAGDGEGAEAMEIELALLDAAGKPIRTYKPEPGDDATEARREDPFAEDPRQLPTKPGLNRFVWDLRYPGAEGFPGLVLWNRRLAGPRAVPGSYRARLTVGEWSGEVDFEVLPDPRVSATAEDFRAQFEFHLGLRDQLSAVHRAIGRVREVRRQLEDLEQRLGERQGAAGIKEASGALDEKMTAIEEKLYQTQNQSPQDPLNFPIRLNDKWAGLMGLASFGDHRPTDQMYTVRDRLQVAIEAALSELEAVFEQDLAAFNELVDEHELAAILLPEPQADDGD